ncbi:MAG: DUF2911 domain-containing protein [Bacteroidetes bacterium]|nr:DUF2911 domain-containing protein [Bacteroidota bacterium]MBS1929744.1 DUF2911 domain-containing protein [Bacteroidota bacterium]
MIRVERYILISAILTILCSCNNNNNSVSQKDSVANNRKLPQEPLYNRYATVDISPMDMSYFPVNYPQLKMLDSVNTPPVIRLIYSRPHLQGRILFHNLLKYGEPWRLGANEATEIQFFRDVKIQNKKIPTGRYILYCIPEEKTWTIVLNSSVDTWGLKIDSSKDIAKFIVPVTDKNIPVEYFTMVFEKTASGANLLMAWANLVAKLSINF